MLQPTGQQLLVRMWAENSTGAGPLLPPTFRSLADVVRALEFLLNTVWRTEPKVPGFGSSDSLSPVLVHIRLSVREVRLGSVECLLDAIPVALSASGESLAAFTEHRVTQALIDLVTLLGGGYVLLEGALRYLRGLKDDEAPPPASTPTPLPEHTKMAISLIRDSLADGHALEVVTIANSTVVTTRSFRAHDPRDWAVATPVNQTLFVAREAEGYLEVLVGIDLGLAMLRDMKFFNERAAQRGNPRAHECWRNLSGTVLAVTATRPYGLPHRWFVERVLYGEIDGFEFYRSGAFT